MAYYLPLAAPVSTSPSQFVYTPFGTSIQFVINGSGLAADPTTGLLAQGTITSIQLVDPNAALPVVVQSVSIPNVSAAALFADVLQPALNIQTTLGGWGVSIASFASFNSGEVVANLADGSILKITGTGFVKGTDFGTIQSITHYQADGQTIAGAGTGNAHQLMNMSMPAGVVTMALGSGAGLYNYLTSGANTVSQASLDYPYQYLDGGAGNDTLQGLVGGNAVASYIETAAGVRVNLTTGIATGGGGRDTLINIDHVIGSVFNDVIIGNANSNQLDGGAGNDTISGGAGDDLLQGSFGDDTLNGGAGQDTILYFDYYNPNVLGVTIDLSLTGPQNAGDYGFDTLVGIENVFGSRANDSITGSAAANVLSGSEGNDTLNGGGGNDTLDGGQGDDIINGGAGTHDIVSFADGYFMNWQGGTVGVTVSLATTAQQNTGQFGLDTITGIEDIVGSRFDDTLTGSNQANVISGGAGDDIIKGLGGNDTLYGGAGNDKLLGGNGDDWLYGGGGSDILTGGAGSDAFVFDSISGPVPPRITDFQVGIDKIHLNADTFGNLTAQLDADSFYVIGSGPRDAEDRFIYNSTTGALFFDPDGSGTAHAAIRFATLSPGLALTASDFVVDDPFMV